MTVTGLININAPRENADLSDIIWYEIKYIIYDRIKWIMYIDGACKIADFYMMVI